MRALRGAVMAAVLVGAALVGTPARAAEAVVLSQGHTDAVDVHYANGRLALKIKDDTVSPAVERDPADVTFQVLPAARTEVPDLDAFRFLGAAGTPIWMLPQVQDPALLWPGWNTTTLDSGVFKNDKVTISLVGVDGPGAVTLFDTSSLGVPAVRFASADGLPDSLDVAVHTHAHASWVFGATGRYTLKFQADAVLANGTVLSTGPVNYRFLVGEDDGSGDGDGDGDSDSGGDGGGQEPNGVSKSITAEIDAGAGALVLSVDPEDREATLPAATLNTTGDRWESNGALRPVSVTDTRAAQPGWSVSGRIDGGFTGPDGATFGGDHLGWTPQVTTQAAGQGVVAGPAATGLGTGGVLGSAPAGKGRGTAELDAGLRLSVPTDTSPGTYRATLTLTAI
ncbi:choice-of-anchor M domain-containing protein [Actinoplanes rectilineatus]|uniref:choice-of-anchor M domain-containing protein n=1 Tax=Actinoplanes rectilineatus TaxID=113571 RepID=UPI000A5F0C2B